MSRHCTQNGPNTSAKTDKVNSVVLIKAILISVRHTSIRFAGICLLLFGFVPAFGDDDDAKSDVPLNELFRSGIVFPQEKGESQWTFAPSFSSDKLVNSLTLPVSFEYGITDAFQFEIEWEQSRIFDRLDRASHFTGNELGFGLQYSWIDIAGSGLHFSLAGEFETVLQQQESTFNSSEDNEEKHRSSYAPSAIFAATIDQLDGLYLYTEAGVEFSGGEQEAFVNMGGILPFDTVALSLEWNWSEEEQFLTPGITFKPGSGWELGLGAGIGLEEDSDNYQLLFNLIYEY